MSVRSLTTQSLLLAAAAATALPLSAQDTTRYRRPSEARISTSKGEVALPPRVDSVYVTRYDTVRVTNTVVRVDTVLVTPPPPPPRMLNAWFWSLFSGASAPVSTVDRLYTTGYHFGVAGGWDPRDSWFGVRLGVSYNQFGRKALFPIFLDANDLFDTDLNRGTPSTWQTTLDLKAKYASGGWSPYLVGGLGFNASRNLATVVDVGDFDNIVFVPGEDVLRLQDVTFCRRRSNDLNEITVGDRFSCFRLPDDNTNFSWSFGLGSDWHIGSQDVFGEVRWNPIRTNGAWTWYMPISLGVRFF